VFNGSARALDGRSAVLGMNTLRGFCALVDAYPSVTNSE